MKLQQEITADIHKVLQLDNAQISPQDNLIEHGLHSLAIMQLVDVFEKKYQKPLSYSDFAMSPTVEEWSIIINKVDQLTEKKDQQAENSDLFPTASVALSDMQYAYWAGRQSEHTSAHLYMEFAGQNINVDQLNMAYQQLIKRHPMLSVSIANGRQSIQSLKLQQITIHDLTHLEKTTAIESLKLIRQKMSHQQLDIENGQVINLQLTLLANQDYVLHVDSDMVAIDPQSFLIVVEDLSSLYTKKSLKPLGHTSIDYFDFLAIRNQDPSYQKEKVEDQQWWQDRIKSFAPAPDLPLIAEGLRENPNHFERLFFSFTTTEKQTLQALSIEHHISMRSLCLAIFTETIATWSSSTRFRLNLPMFIREPYLADVDRIVGDFTHLSLLNVAMNSSDSLLKCAQRIEEEVNEVTQHYTYGGIHILRDLAKRQQQQETSPIVFTSALEVGEIFSSELQDTLGKPIWCISQGPKVDLDVQIAYFNDELVVNWDIRRHAFKPNVAQAMFDHYISNIKALISEPDRLHSIFDYQLPMQQALLRQPQKISLSQNITDHLGLDTEDAHYRVVNTLQKDCPDWVIGKLWINISQHQLDQVDKKRIYIDQNQHWYDTDYDAYFNDQADIFVSSDKHQVTKINGYWIDLSDIQQRIQDIAGIDQVKVYETSESEQIQLIAMICPVAGVELKSEYLSTEYAARLPQYLIPQYSYLIDQMELETIADQDLRHFRESRLSLEEIAASQSHIATPLEKVVYFMMCRVIGIHHQVQDLNMDFFDHGGDSLLATHFVASLNQYFKDCQISVMDIFSQRTAKNIARTIENNLPHSAQQIAEVFLNVMKDK